jgi:acetyltransferase-like isoleucine patch superfamily enzyme
MNSLNDQNEPVDDGGKNGPPVEATSQTVISPSAEQPHSLRVERYRPDRKPEWNAFLQKGKNCTFLFQRDYMEYHADRFVDFSLMVYRGAELCALLPANLVDGRKVCSYQGLTYGGFVFDRKASLNDTLECYHATLRYMHENQIQIFELRPIPSFYNSLPSDEVNYALFLLDARLVRRDCALVINQRDSLPLRKGRKSEISKGKRFGVTILEEQDYAPFWNQVLIPRLRAKYGVKPVHTLEEITMLARRFPENIKQLSAYHEGQIVAGATIFETPTVAHCQYLGVTEAGRKIGALDYLCGWLIGERYQNKDYFDFGICNEQQGRVLNHGMLDWKEAFGGRTCCHDFHEISCANYTMLESVLASNWKTEHSSGMVNTQVMANTANKLIHPKALISPDAIIGEGTRVWAFASIAAGAIVGKNCNICDHTFIETGVRLGNNVTMKCGVYLWKGLTAEDYVFIGPGAVFINDRRPRSGRKPPDFLPTLLKQGCSIGANATILPGTIGRWAVVAAGSVVTHDVPDHALVKGSPARIAGWVCRCGEKLKFHDDAKAACACGRSFQKTSESAIQEILI